MKHYQAVTLVEIAIVIAIIGIVAGVMTVSLQSGRSSSRLQTARRNVAAAIKLAQSYALQGKTQVGTTGVSTPCGYGFRFTANNAYEIFYNPLSGFEDCNEQNDVSNTGSLQYNGTSKTAESYEVNDKVTLNSPSVADLSSDNDTEIYFTVPHANAFKNDGTEYNASQNLEFIFSGSTEQITVYRGGYIYEK